MAFPELVLRLSGGERKSLGCAAAVAEEMKANPQKIGTLLQVMTVADPIVRSRAMAVLKMLTLTDSQWVLPFKKRLIEEIAEIPQWEVREQFCILITKLPLTSAEAESLVPRFQSYLDDRSSIVRTCAMQALVDLTAVIPHITDGVRAQITHLTMSGTAAMRARGRKLLKKLS